jgi:hypothetical protein
VGEKNAETSSFHVLVARLRLLIGWNTDAGIRCFSYTFILPPLIVAGTTAAHIWQRGLKFVVATFVISIHSFRSSDLIICYSCLQKHRQASAPKHRQASTHGIRCGIRS